MKLRTIDSLELGERRALVRCDLNLTLDGDGVPVDASRVERLKPTVAELARRGARILLASHFGRPRGRPDPDLSLSRIVDPIGEILGAEEIAIVPDCVGATAEAVSRDLAPGGIALLENLRFHPGEEANDPSFAGALARLGDAYVNDAFSAAHRRHASVVGVPALLPAAAGRAVETEVAMLDRVLGGAGPEGGSMAIVGGAKVATKIAAFRHLAARVDAIAVGGAMANTFLAARGHDLRDSLVEESMVGEARSILEAAEAEGCEMLLPVDAVAAREAAPGAEAREVPVDAVPGGHRVLDIGPETCDLYGNRLAGVRFLVWSGPLGLWEIPPFDRGTAVIGRTAALLTRGGALVSVAGGGDTAAALNHAGLAGGFSYVSVAGGAFLQWLEGRTLPGLAPLAA